MRLKLHHLPDSELANQQVTRQSRWHDHRWIFDNLTAGQRSADSIISWHIHLPDGSYLTDTKWAQLLDSFRRLIWSLFTAPQNSVRYKPGMASDFGRQVSYFARWMVANGYHSFSELDEFAFDEYVDSVREDKFTDPDTAPTATLLLKFLKLPPLIWAQATELQLAGIEPPSVAPYRGRSAFAVAKELAEDARGQVPPIPDDVFLKIINSSIAVLDDSDDIASCVDAFVEISDGLTAMSERRRAEALESFRRRAADLYPRAAPYLQSGGVWLIKDALADAREACSSIVFGCVGLRTAEYCGLECGPTQTGYPACVTMRRSVSGLDEIFFISGRVYKGEHGWTAHEWVAGVRPVGTTHLPLPVRAVIVLEKLFRCFRSAKNMERLALYTPNAQKFLTRDEQFNPATADVVRRSLKTFVERRTDITDWNITPSQWRKTFAQFVVRTDSRMPPALRDHFHQVNLAITEVGYASADPEYRQVLDDAAVQNSIDFLGSLVSEEKTTSGTMVETVRRSAARLRTRLGNRDDEEIKNDIEEIVRETGIRVHELRFGGSEAGDCVFRPGTGRCTEGCIARWVMPSPLWSAARPDACWDCENIVISPEHEEFWSARLERHRRAYASANTSGDVSLAYLARTRMMQCATVLQKLGAAVSADLEDGFNGER